MRIIQHRTGNDFIVDPSGVSVDAVKSYEMLATLATVSYMLINVRMNEQDRP